MACERRAERKEKERAEQKQLSEGTRANGCKARKLFPPLTSICIHTLTHSQLLLYWLANFVPIETLFLSLSLNKNFHLLLNCLNCPFEFPSPFPSHSFTLSFWFWFSPLVISLSLSLRPFALARIRKRALPKLSLSAGVSVCLALNDKSVCFHR